MSLPQIVPLQIVQGDNFGPVFRWFNEDSKVYRNVTAVPQLAPIRLTIAGHGIPDGWMVTPDNFLGMKELNDVGETPAKFVDVNTVELNAVNGAGFKPYTGGGTLEFYEPFDLAGFTARMQVRASIESASILLDLTSAASEILLNNTTKTIQPVLDAAATAAITDWISGVYDLELVSAGGVVTKIARGPIIVAVKEVTR